MNSGKYSMPRRKMKRVISPMRIEKIEIPQIRTQRNRGCRSSSASQAARKRANNFMARREFSLAPLDGARGPSYVLCSRGDQRRAGCSPNSARLPGGSPRGCKPWASEPAPNLGPREPASAISGNAAWLKSDRLRQFFVPRNSSHATSASRMAGPGQMQARQGGHWRGNSWSRISLMNRSIETG